MNIISIFLHLADAKTWLNRSMSFGVALQRICPVAHSLPAGSCVNTLQQISENKPRRKFRDRTVKVISCERYVADRSDRSMSRSIARAKFDGRSWHLRRLTNSVKTNCVKTANTMRRSPTLGRSCCVVLLVCLSLVVDAQWFRTYSSSDDSEERPRWPP